MTTLILRNTVTACWHLFTKANNKWRRRREIIFQCTKMVHQNSGEQRQMLPHLVSEMRKMSDYNGAIFALNKLQSNSDVLDRSKRFPLDSALRNVPDTIKYLARLGIKVEDLDELRAIHVSGTKGKGSTCAFCESILRHHNFKTGFFSSPHIIAVRERIRINGRPLSEDQFATYFWTVYDSLFNQRKHEDDMPPYFKFLTIMAFYVFLSEKVDVAVLEVGIGGQYDCTNILRKPIICGITSLGLDHTSILGSTLQKIAWQKAGIMKQDVPAFTCAQKEEAMKVLAQRARNIGTQLMVTRSLDISGNELTLGLSGEVQLINAALALHLAGYWIEKRKNPFYSLDTSNETFSGVPQGPIIAITEPIATGLQKCEWAGRYQRLKQGNVMFYLDGAHTAESIQACVKWFKDSLEETEKDKKIVRGLLFSITGDRSSQSLLEPLLKGHFDVVCFCPTTLHSSNHVAGPADLMNMSVSKDLSLQRCQDAEKTFLDLMTKIQETNDRHWWTKVFPSISSAILYFQSEDYTKQLKTRDYTNLEVHLLVTGSLHLVGGVLGIIQPNLNEENFL